MDRMKIAFAGLSVVCATLAFTAAVTPAFSKPQNEVVVQGRAIDPETQRVVSYRDLNLANAEGRKVLVRRVGYAVTDICSPGYNGGLDLMSAERTCRRTAWDSANPQLKRAFDIALAGGVPTVAIAIVAAAPGK